LLQAAPSLSFGFLVVMPFAGFSEIIFGESPDNHRAHGENVIFQEANSNAVTFPLCPLY